MASGEGARGGWWKLLQVAVSLVAVYTIARLVDLRQAADVLAAARPAWALGAVLLYVAGQGLSAYRWRLIGASVGLGGGLARYLRFYFIGMFFMFFGPSTLGGDLVRGLYLAEGGGGRGGRALNSVLFDRLNGLVVLVAIGAAAFVLFPGYGLPPPLFYAAVTLGAGLFLGWWLAPWLVRLALPAGHRVRRFVETDLGPFWSDRGMLVGVSAVSVVFHLVQIGAQYLVSRALGLGLPLSYICIFHPLVSALTAVPIGFSGIGIRELGYIYFLEQIGVDRASATAYGVLWLLVIVANSLLGGLVFLASGARLPRVRDALR